MEEDDLKEYLTNPKTGFTGLQELEKRLKRTNPDYDKNALRKQYKSLHSNQVFRKHKKSLHPILPKPFKEQLQMDLIDFSQRAFVNQNYGRKYILVIMETLSRYCWLFSIKDKTPKLVLPCLKAVIKQLKQNPKEIISDDGSEFKGIVGKFMKDSNIEHITHFEHANLVERAIGTIKGYFGKYFEANQTKKYYKIVDDIQENYNTHFHRGINATPEEVLNDAAIRDDSIRYQWKSYHKRLQKHNQVMENLPDLNIGDKVRLLQKKTFKQNYQPHYNENIYTIQDKVNSMYKLTGMKILQPRYKLQKVTIEDFLIPQSRRKLAKEMREHAEFMERQERAFTRGGLTRQEVPQEEYFVEAIRDRRYKDGDANDPKSYQYLIKWLNWEETDNSWEPYENVEGNELAEDYIDNVMRLQRVE